MIKYWRMSVLTILVWSAVIFAAPVYAVDDTLKIDSAAGECASCHTCGIPTVKDLCLSDESARRAMVHQVALHDISEAPDTVVIEPLAKEYAPVCFSHKLHAEMSGMAGECSTCHHFSPAGTVPPCRDCHPTAGDTGTSEVPLLGVAYHMQCRNCHETWSHDQNCAPCHQRFQKGEMSKRPGQRVPGEDPVPVPVSRVYQTTRDSASFVTFQHIEHIELFQFACTDCHRQESCARCHDVCKTGAGVSGSTNARMICVCCHRMDPMNGANQGCVECHDVQEHPPMFHEIVGESLPAYLEKDSCQSCHQRKM